MNKQELIESISNLPSDCSGPLPMINKLAVLKFIKLLDEPQKVTIPQFVGNWINYCKNTNVTLVRALLVEEIDLYNYANQKDSKELKEFLKVKGNQELFARAWLDGYEIEKEKRYLVKMKGMQKDCVALKKNKKGGYWYLSDTYPYGSTVNFHTRKELEDAGFGWVFDCPGIEVKEVTE